VAVEKGFQDWYAQNYGGLPANLDDQSEAFTRQDLYQAFLAGQDGDRQELLDEIERLRETLSLVPKEALPYD
jgi:hypothetical protein